MKVRVKKRYYFHDSEVTKQQAQLIKSVGGRVVTTRDDQYIRKYWS